MMRISTNISHWVCVLMGLVLIATGLLSHVHRQATNGAVADDNADAGTGAGKRAVLIAIGLIAVAYGVSRVLS